MVNRNYVQTISILFRYDDFLDQVLMVSEKAQEDSEVLHYWIVDSDGVGVDNTVSAVYLIGSVLVSFVDKFVWPLVLTSNLFVPGFESHLLRFEHWVFIHGFVLFKKLFISI